MNKGKHKDNIPGSRELMIPVIKALQALGGSGTIDEINEKVYEIKGFTEEQLQVPHNDIDSRSEIEYRLAWAKTHLKNYGLLENSSRGVWTLRKPDINADKLNASEISRFLEKIRQKTLRENGNQPTEEIEENISWKETLIKTLLQISPSSFERLIQRLLRESGFIEVEVTGKSGDGGIDGKGIVRLSGFLSFHVIFQCKRYKNSTTPSQIRDFRGAMQGRAEKGIFITTGSFTRDARKEATRDGAPPIDLIDGDLLCEKLKEFSIGVKTRVAEEVEVNQDFFTNF